MQRFLRAQAIAAYCAFALVLAYVLVDQAGDKGLQLRPPRLVQRAGCWRSSSTRRRATASWATPWSTSERDGPRQFLVLRSLSGVLQRRRCTRLMNTFDLVAGDEDLRRTPGDEHPSTSLTLAFAVALLVELCIPPGIAVAAVALAGSGRILVFYRDMVHFDQAAMAGFMASPCGPSRAGTVPATTGSSISSPRWR